MDGTSIDAAALGTFISLGHGAVLSVEARWLLLEVQRFLGWLDGG